MVSIRCEANEVYSFIDSRKNLVSSLVTTNEMVEVSYKFVFSFIALHYTSIFALKARYDNYRVVEININNPEQLKIVSELESLGFILLELPHQIDCSRELWFYHISLVNLMKLLSNLC